MHQSMQGAKAPEPVTEQRMLSSAELADYLQLTEETVRRLARSGTIPSVTVARRIRYDLAAVLHVLEHGQEKARTV